MTFILYSSLLLGGQGADRTGQSHHEDLLHMIDIITRIKIEDLSQGLLTDHIVQDQDHT